MIIPITPAPVSRLAELTGAEVVGAPPNPAVKRPYLPDRILGEGDVIETELGPLRAIATPGHTAGHLCLALEGSTFLFSGDHVMGWSTSVVVPPDGSMADYMASLDRLLIERRRSICRAMAMRSPTVRRGSGS